MTSLRQAHAQELASYREARRINDAAMAWCALERAHILSQPVLSIHMATHFEMLKYAVMRHDGREFLGQMVRLVFAPFGSLTGRIPYGNTGRANVSAFKAMPISEELQAILDSVES